jgi:hypothetical protein
VSHSIDETYEVYNEVSRTARKGHICDACDEPIRPGDRYCSVHVVFDHNAETIKRCLRCQEIHNHLRDLGGGETWPAERLDCGEDYREHWGREPPAEIAALAFATADEMQASASSEVDSAEAASKAAVPSDPPP